MDEEESGAPRIVLEGTGVVIVPALDTPSPVLRISFPESDADIEIEMPEHIGGNSGVTGKRETLYFKTPGAKLPAYAWSRESSGVVCRMKLKNGIDVTATVTPDSDGIVISYDLHNHSKTDYELFTPTTCVRLHGDFKDVYLERTYVHHADGFELLASETPDRKEIPVDDWLPCRYRALYGWKLSPKFKPFEIKAGVRKYNKMKQLDLPVIATVSSDKQWIIATYTRKTGALWSNPGRTCHHADPSTVLPAGKERRVNLKVYIFKGELDELAEKVRLQLAE